MNIQPNAKQTEIRILQANVNTSRNSQEELINSQYIIKYDIIALQEPFLDFKSDTRATSQWRAIYPTNHTRDIGTRKTRAILLINKRIRADAFQPLRLNSPDIVAVRIIGNEPNRHMDIYNIYACGDSETALRQMERKPTPEDADEIWLGDFNCHDPLWDEDRNHHLFTPAAKRRSNIIIKATTDRNLYQALPKDIPTLHVFWTGNLTRPDNVFIAERLRRAVIYCDAMPEIMPVCTDHFPIATTIRRFDTGGDTEKTRIQKGRLGGVQDCIKERAKSQTPAKKILDSRRDR